MPIERRVGQQPEPADYVIATGETHTVADFAREAFRAVGLNWLEHTRQDPAFMRPAEVPVLRGDATRAREQMGWEPKVTFDGLVRMMVAAE